MNNCYKLNHRKQNGGIGEVTSLLDWNTDELEELGSLSVRYSGISSSYEVMDVKEKEYLIQKSTREFPELGEYNSPEKKCSTSWVSATIELAETALDHNVRLSSRQLFECLPKDEDIDGCEGVNMRTLSDYLRETGLMSENDFKNCESINPLYTYHFSSISPEVPTGSGLMNLMFDEKNPVLVLVALNLDKLRFVKDMSNVDEGYKCGGYQPSVYGLLTGYKYSGIEDSWWEIRSHVVPGEEIVLKVPMSLDMTNANYGGIAAYAFVLKSDDMNEGPSEVITESPSDNPTVSESPSESFGSTGVPTERMTDAPTAELTELPSESASTDEPTEPSTDIPSVSVITEEPTEEPTEMVTEEPTTEIPTVEPSTIPPTTEVPTEPACEEDLVVTSESDCVKLFTNGWKTITVNEGLCNSIESDLMLCDNPCLQEIVIKKNSLQNLNSLKISNNTVLKSIETEDGDGDFNDSSLNTGVFYYVTNVTISC